jgi:hypothetical protein
MELVVMRRKVSTLSRFAHVFAVVLFIVSLLLIGNIIFCLAYPMNYPIKNLEDRVPLRSYKGLVLPENQRIFLISSVQFVDAPMNTKLLDEVHLNSLEEADFHSSFEYRLTENATVTLSEALFLGYEEVSDLQASLDGVNVNCKVAEYEGNKYYVVPELNLTAINEVRNFVTSFRYKIVAKPNRSVRIPLLFNENYAQYVNMPLSLIQVQKNTTSDICTFRVRFDLPFRRILVEDSGWKDAFVPPQSEWVLNPDNRTYRFDVFEYPIAQERIVNDNTYSFETYFSEKDLANTPSVTLFLDWKIPVLLALFLASPFYIYIFSRLTLSKLPKRRKSNEPNEQKSQSKWPAIRSFLWIVVKLYSIPLGAAVYIDVSSATWLLILPYAYEVINPIFLFLVFSYPALFSISYYLWKGKI